jgi:hypothetical protein
MAVGQVNGGILAIVDFTAIKMLNFVTFLNNP